MFLMTADIKIGPFKPVKPNAFRWQRSITDYADSATVKIPTLCRLKKNGEVYEKVDTALQITEGMAITIMAGYDGINPVRFMGFIKRINYTIPLELECEGYSYQLRTKYFTKSYKSTSLKEVLQLITEGTDIKLSSLIPDVELKNVVFENVNGCDVIEALINKFYCKVYFNFDTLFAGLEQVELKSTIKHRLGWNVVSDNELKFDANKELANVNIRMEKRDATGFKRKVKSNDSINNDKVYKVDWIVSDADMKRIAEEKRKELVNRGYEGKITAFLTPTAEPGMATEISDLRYPERTGKYFITSVDGSFDTSGGRQRISIGRTL